MGDKTAFKRGAKLLVVLSALLLLFASASALASGGEFYGMISLYPDGTVEIDDGGVGMSHASTPYGYGFTGYMATRPYSFVIDTRNSNSNLSGTEIVAALNAAMQTWNDALDTPLFTLQNTLGNAGRSGNSSGYVNSWNNRSEIFFMSYNSGAVATCFYRGTSSSAYTGYPATYVITEADIVFNTRVSWSDCERYYRPSSYDLQAIATHELGHALGLIDVYDTTWRYVTMFGSGVSGDTQKRTLETPDLIGLSSLYDVKGYGAEARVTTSGDSLNLRRSASTSSSVIVRIPNGSRVKILSTSGSWSMVRYNYRIGYVMTSYLTTTAAATPAPTAAPTARVTARPTTAPTIAPTTAPTTTYATVRTTGGRLNLRSSASTSSAIMAQLANGTRVTVISRGSTWSYVQYGTLRGYLMNSYLTFSSTPTVTAAPTSYVPATARPTTAPTVLYGTVTASSLNVRSAMSTSSNVITRLYRGAVVTITATYSDWYQIRIGSQYGYVARQYVTVNSTVVTTPAPTVRPSATQPPACPYNTIIKSTYAYIYPRADRSTNYLFLLAQGTEITVTHHFDNGWIKVRFMGIDGYLYNDNGAI